MNQKLVNILIIFLLLAGAWALWLWWSSDDPEPAGIVGGFGVVVDGPSQSEFLQILNQIRHLELDRSVFNDPRLSEQLADTTTPLPSRSAGRSNPFAPFGSGNVSGSTFGEGGLNTPQASGFNLDDLSPEELSGLSPTELGLTEAEFQSLLDGLSE